MVNSVAKAGTSVTKVKEEMVENNVGKNSDPDLTATEHRLFQIFNASPEVANSIANWSERRNISIIPEICAYLNKDIANSSSQNSSPFFTFRSSVVCHNCDILPFLDYMMI